LVELGDVRRLPLNKGGGGEAIVRGKGKLVLVHAKGNFDKGGSTNYFAPGRRWGIAGGGENGKKRTIGDKRGYNSPVFKRGSMSKREGGGSRPCGRNGFRKGRASKEGW